MIELARLNAVPAGEFTTALDGIFEHSPWVAGRAAAHRPFTSRLQLGDRMRAVVNEAPAADQLALMRAHPRLGARGRTLASLTTASRGEQHRAGLDACSDEEYARLLQLNDAYMATFSFPFILAVRGHDPASIVACCEERLGNSAALERATALRQIGLIASYRLAERVAADDQAEFDAMSARLAQAAGKENACQNAWLREWMLGAGLEVIDRPGAWPAGRLRGDGNGLAPVLLASPDETLLAILVALRLRQRQLRCRRGIETGAQPAGTCITMDWTGAGARSAADRVRALENFLVSGSEQP